MGLACCSPALPFFVHDKLSESLNRALQFANDSIDKFVRFIIESSTSININIDKLMELIERLL